MSSRDFDFIVGPETSVLPTASTPTNDEDTINKGWLEEYGFCRGAIHCGVANITALKAIGPTVRQDKQVCLVQNVGIYEFDSTDTQTDDGSTVIQPTSGSGRWLLLTAGAGGGAGSQYNFLAGEAIDGSTTAKMVALKQEDVIYLTAANSWIDINEGGGEVSVQILSADSYFRRYDLGVTSVAPGEEAYDLCEQIKDDLNAAGGLALTYDCTYSATTRKITVSASGSFNILLKSGTHGADGTDTGLLKFVGYDDTSDTGSATSHPGDDAFELWTGKTTQLLGFKTDADYIVKSRNYMGGVEDANSKLAETTGKLNTALSGFSAETAGAKLYTESAQITIDSTNNKVDFKEGAGAELNATLTSGSYSKGTDTYAVKYSELCTEIKTQLEALGALTYTVTFDNNTQKFTISATGAFTLLWGTGTNSATNTAETLGWADSDTTSSTSHTSTSAVDYSGTVGEAGDTNVVTESVYTGFVTSDDKLFSKHSDLSVYDEVYKTPGDWLTTPLTQAYSPDSNGLQLHDVAVSSNGYGVMLLCDNQNPSTFRIRYKYPNGAWTNATTTIAEAFNGSSAFGDNFGGNYYRRSRCAVDENGHAFLALSRYNVGDNRYELWHAWSTDLDTWTLNATALAIPPASQGHYVGDVAIREGKGVILSNYTLYTDSFLWISDHHVTNGYNTWSSGINLPGDMIVTGASRVLIQYFPAETGINKHRIVAVGQRGSDGHVIYNYAKGDGTGTASGVLMAGNFNMSGAAIDSIGVGNRIVITASAGTNMYYADSNETYNGGTLTWDNHSLSSVTGAGTWDLYNGYSATGADQLIWNIESRMVVLGKKVYHVRGAYATGFTDVFAKLLYSKDITTGTWETVQNINTSPTTSWPEFEYCCVYIPSIHSVMCGWKDHNYNASTNEVLTEGRIFGRLFELDGSGDPIWHAKEQIDGGEVGTTFNGYFTLSEEADRVVATWEHNTSTNNEIWWNNFI